MYLCFRFWVFLVWFLVFLRFVLSGVFVSSFLRLTRSRLAIFWGRVCYGQSGFVSVYACVSVCTAEHTKVRDVYEADASAVYWGFGTACDLWDRLWLIVQQPAGFRRDWSHCSGFVYVRVSATCGRFCTTSYEERVILLERYVRLFSVSGCISFLCS